MATSGTVEGSWAKLSGYNFFYARGKWSITENASSITVTMNVYVVMASSASESGSNFRFSYAFMDSESWSGWVTSNNSNYFNTATEYKIGSISKTYNKGTSTQTIHPWIRIQDTYTGNPDTSTSSSSYSGTYTIPVLTPDSGTPTNPTVSTYNSITKIKIGSTTYDIKDAKLRISSATPYTKIKEYSTGITHNTNATDLANIVNYSLFGLAIGLSASATLGVFLIGTWYFNNYTKGAWQTDAEIHGCMSYDDESAYVLKGSLKCTSTNGTCLYRGSSHTLTSSGNTRSTGYLKQVWGLF